VKPVNALLSVTGTNIFTTMSTLAARHQAINLGQGFPDTDGPADVLAAAAAALADGHNQYAPMTGVPELRQAVAAANARFYGLAVDPDREVVVTSGATEALAVSMMALLDRGDEVVVFEPLYDTYLPMLRALGAVPRLVRLAPPKWELPRAELAAAFGPRTKAILFNTPMNPTGKVFTAAELAFIADLMTRHDAYAICDEVYEHITFDGWRHIPLMTLPGMRERCIRIGSAGKTFSLTGWKIGYATACPALATVLGRAHQNLIFSSAPNLQRAVAVGLAKDDAYFAALAAGLASRRDRLAEGLRRVGFGVLPVQGAYFLNADFAPLGFAGDDQAFCRHITEQAGVAAIPVTAFYEGPGPSHYARFAFCKREEVLDAAVERLTRHFAARAAAPSAGNSIGSADGTLASSAPLTGRARSA
jgi:N-succinyldiaminopimelate aminotransferase